MANNSQWLGISPLQGSGDGTITVSAGQNDGEKRRTCNIMVSTATRQVPVVVTQGSVPVDVFTIVVGSRNVSSYGGEILIKADESIFPEWGDWTHKEAYWSGDVNLINGIYDWGHNDINGRTEEAYNLSQSVIISVKPNLSGAKRSVPIYLWLGDNCYVFTMTQEASSSSYLDIRKVTSLDESITYQPSTSDRTYYYIDSGFEGKIFFNSTDGIKNIRPYDGDWPSIYLTDEYCEFTMHSISEMYCFENNDGFAAIIWITRYDKPYFSSDKIGIPLNKDGEDAYFHFCEATSVIGLERWFEYDFFDELEIYDIDGNFIGPFVRFRNKEDFFARVKPNPSNEPREIAIYGHTEDDSRAIAELKLIQL